MREYDYMECCASGSCEVCGGAQGRVRQAVRSEEDVCVGFADCPCRKCRQTRLTVTGAHPHHPRPDASYCGVCRTQERERYRA